MTRKDPRNQTQSLNSWRDHDSSEDELEEGGEYDDLIEELLAEIELNKGKEEVETPEDSKRSEELSKAFAAKAFIPIIAEDEEHHQLLRTSSGMSNYSDLLEDMLDQHGVEEVDFSSDSINYEELEIVRPSEEKRQAQDRFEDYKKNYKGAKKAPPKTAKKVKSPARKRRESSEYKKKSQEHRSKIKSSKDISVDLEAESEDKRTHLFRGKNLTSKFMDPVTKKLRMRSRDEIYKYVTRKYPGRTILSDGLEYENVSPEKKNKARDAVRKYFREIKDKRRKNTLFNAGKSYTKAVGDLRQLTSLSNNPVVATSKLPWVASEYGVGQMGGASGGGRGTDLAAEKKHRAVGYGKDRRPVNRVLANGFVVSVPMRDYYDLRASEDLVDVNSDVGFGVEPNRMIEEVTFNLEIEGKYVLGSLPLVLPRLDRDYEKMDENKRLQYKKIFGLDEEKYKELQKEISEQEVKIGKITEHLIKHHGSLLRAIAIKRDRLREYEDKFVITHNSSFQGAIQDIHTPQGSELSRRAARKGSASKSSGHVEDGSTVSSQVSRIRRDDTDYADDELDNIFSSHLPQDVAYISPSIAITPHLSTAIDNFIANPSQTQSVIAISYQGHFTAIHIQKLPEDGYKIIYFEPVLGIDGEPLHQIPANILDVINSKFPGVEIINSESSIQPITVLEDEKILIDNHHCGPFISYFMIELSRGNIRLSQTRNLETILEDGSWQDIGFLTKKESFELGRRIRSYHASYLTGSSSDIDHKKIIVDFFDDIEKGILNSQDQKDIKRRLFSPEPEKNSRTPSPILSIFESAQGMKKKDKEKGSK